MKAVQVKNIPLMKRHQRSPAIQTTLYELMETVIDVAMEKSAPNQSLRFLPHESEEHVLWETLWRKTQDSQ
jgi:copper oxidase (laccase) domain-containing protein